MIFQGCACLFSSQKLACAYLRRLPIRRNVQYCSPLVNTHKKKFYGTDAETSGVGSVVGSCIYGTGKLQMRWVMEAEWPATTIRSHHTTPSQHRGNVPFTLANNAHTSEKRSFKGISVRTVCFVDAKRAFAPLASQYVNCGRV
jgi:hypothetical protein